MATATELREPSGGRPSLAALMVWRSAALVFLASCGTLVIELVAGRLLSPHVGSSLYTWTTVIGVVLAGISLGNWIGGRVADRYPSARTVGVLFLLGGLTSLFTIGLFAALGDGAFLRPIPLLARIFLLTTVAFFPVSFVLGMVCPVVIRISLPDTARTGRVVGLVYAVSTLGSLAGNFLTGFVLVAWLPVTTIVLGVAVALLVCGALGGEWWRPSPKSAAHHPPIRVVDEQRSPDLAESASRVQSRTDGPFSLRGNVVLACGVVVVASFCSMTLELVASRTLAPYVGVSLYSWTGIIGVVLAGVTIGNYLGGWVADRWSRQGVLGAALALGGLASLGTLVAIQIAGVSPALASLGLMERIVALTLGVYFVPVLFLGMVSPQVIKLAVTDVAHAGRTAGRIYAWSTAGAIAGTFATGYVLISLLGVNRLVLVAGLVLIALGFAAGRFWRSLPAIATVALVTAGSLYTLSERNAVESPCTTETNYFCIKVRDDVHNGNPVRLLVLDHLIHSFVKLDDPSYLGYGHEKVQTELTRYAAIVKSSPRVLVIGGGGYTYPRWVEANAPTVGIDVVEIDPGVVEVNYEHLGLKRDTRIISYSMDGRQFIVEHAKPASYDLVIQDAVNDLSVPYHLMTKEYNDRVKEILTDDGVYLLTVIDLYRDGQLMRAAARTMKRTFPDVQLLATTPVWTAPGSNVFVIAGSKKPLDVEEVRQALRENGVAMPQTIAQPEADLDAYVAEGPQIVLTDQYAPVDNLISLLFRNRN